MRLEAFYERPAFGLLRDSSGLVEEVFSRLARQGLRLRDLRIVTGDEGLAGAYLQIDIPHLSVSGRVHLHQVKLDGSDVSKAGRAAFAELVSHVLASLRAAVPDLAFQGYGSAHQFHGRLAGVTAREFLRQWVKDAPGPRVPSGAGVAFRFDAHGETLWSSLTLDESTVVKGGLFLASLVGWDASKLTSEELAARAMSLMERSCEDLGLRLQEVV